MDVIRHVALGFCVISTIAGVIRIFWPENSFTSVINTILVLYIITAGLQLLRGTDWQMLTAQLYDLTATTEENTLDYSAYGRQLGLAASADAVREVLENADVEAVVTLDNNTCCVTLVHADDYERAESLLASSCGTLPYELTVGGDVP